MKTTPERMAQKLVQTETQIQTQTLSSLQVALAGLIELPAGDLADRIRDEMVDNAALEERTESEPETDESGFADNSEAEAETPDTELGMAMGDYRSDDDIPDYLLARADASRDEYQETTAASTHSFYEELISQIGEHQLTDHERDVLTYLVGSRDEDGLLRKDLLNICDELAFHENIITDEAELNRLLQLLQTFEPHGIGARSLQECLALQLKSQPRRTPWTPMALRVIEQYFKDFTARRWDVLQQKLGVDKETMTHVRHELTHLNPRPGLAFSETSDSAAPTVIPDFYVSVNVDGSIALRLNNDSVPELCVSRAFRDSIREYAAHRDQLSRKQQEEYLYARKKVEDAQNFIGLIRRRNETMLSVMRAIIHLQRPFFDDDDETLLQPLKLKAVADLAHVDISTVSRTVNSKYVQTDHAVYPLKFFFSSQFTSKDGEELSSRQVRTALQEIIDGEDKSQPYTDDQLVGLLREKGFSIARRTVVKYRDQLGIASTRYRKV